MIIQISEYQPRRRRHTKDKKTEEIAWKGEGNLVHLN